MMEPDAGWLSEQETQSKLSATSTFAMRADLVSTSEASEKSLDIETHLDGPQQDLQIFRLIPISTFILIVALLLFFFSPFTTTKTPRCRPTPISTPDPQRFPPYDLRVQREPHRFG